MTAQNTTRTYGSVARLLHWLTALLILTAIPLGLYANDLPYDTGEALARKAQLFSLHKTLGIAVFMVALVRIVWAVTQPRPAPLHPERRLETSLAEVAHWTLYLSLVLVPLSGWVHHAATDGFAPILWPLGQNLFFVPTSETVAGAAAALHWVFTKVLIATILLHVAGAMKHAIVDMDATLGRMTSGIAGGPLTPPAHRRWPALAALGIYAVGAATAVALTAPQTMPTAIAAVPPTTTQTTGNWQVTEGTITFGVQQMGSAVQGSFPGFTADITFDEQPVAGKNGTVSVTIDMTSVTLGSVSDQVRGPDFFDTATHPTARFTADILPDGANYVANGTLDLRGTILALSLPFQLALTGDTARMTGTITLDRRDFGLGASYKDEATVGFAVPVTIALTATRR